MTKSQMLEAAAKMEEEADNLYMSLLAPSMRERALRDDARALREQAANVA